MSICMTNINISIKEEAYRFLKTLKIKNKSFSDVILGFKYKNQNIMRFFGILNNIDWGNREKEMREFRKEFEERFE